MPTYHVPGGKTQFFTPTNEEEAPPNHVQSAGESDGEYTRIEEDDDTGVEIIHPPEKKVHFAKPGDDDVEIIGSEPPPRKNDFMYLVILLAIIAFIFFAKRI